MIFVVVLTAAEYFAPFIVLGIIVGGYLIDEGIVQNAVLNWFSHWVFTPSFFLAVLPFFVLLLIFNVWLFDKLSYTFSEHSDKVEDILGKVGAVLCAANFLQLLFLFIYFFPELFDSDYSWLWNNTYYEWLWG